MKNTVLTAGLCAAALSLSSTGAHAQGYGYALGEVVRIAADFCPKDTLEADGRLLPIAQNTALFSILGTRYGGDGRTTFALPDLRGAQKSANADGSQQAIRFCIVTAGIFPSRN